MDIDKPSLQEGIIEEKCTIMYIDKQSLQEGIIREMSQIEVLIQLSQFLLKKNKLLMEEMEKVKNLTRGNCRVKMYKERANMIKRIIKKIEDKKNMIIDKMEQIKTVKK